jgi:hypothetical protein
MTQHTNKGPNSRLSHYLVFKDQAISGEKVAIGKKTFYTDYISPVKRFFDFPFSFFQGESLLITENTPSCQLLFSVSSIRLIVGTERSYVAAVDVRVRYSFVIGLFCYLERALAEAFSISFQRNETGFTSPPGGCQLLFSFLLEFYEISFCRHAALFPFH